MPRQPASKANASRERRESSTWADVRLDDERLRRVFAPIGERKEVVFVRLRFNYEPATLISGGDGVLEDAAGPKFLITGSDLRSVSASDPSGVMSTIFEKSADGLAEYIATELDNLDQPVWQLWDAPVEQWLAHDDQSVVALQQMLHRALVGIPTEKVLSGLEFPFAEQAAVFAEQIPINSVDNVLGPVGRFIEVVGIVAGVMSGNPILACACFKALIHDELHRGLSETLQCKLSRIAI